eukprot:2013756-Lingulodinium_polyedra.AAC.1
MAQNWMCILCTTCQQLCQQAIPTFGHYLYLPYGSSLLATEGVSSLTRSATAAVGLTGTLFETDTYNVYARLLSNLWMKGQQAIVLYARHTPGRSHLVKP